MHFKARLSLPALLLVYFACSIVFIAKAQESTLPTADSTGALPPATKGVYKPLIFLTGVLQQSTNDEFYQNYFKQGLGVQLGVSVYSTTYYTIRFSIGYTNFKFDKNDFVHSDTSYSGNGENVRTSSLQTVSFVPDVMVHPFPQWLVSPYLNAGLGLVVGSKDPSAIVTNPDGTETKRLYSFGSRYIGQVGAGAIVDMTKALSLVVNASYNFEFLQNNQQEDIFYKFKNPTDPNYKYLYFQVGLLFKIERK
jgi:hypothetical protein